MLNLKQAIFKLKTEKNIIGVEFNDHKLSYADIKKECKKHNFRVVHDLGYINRYCIYKEL